MLVVLDTNVLASAVEQRPQMPPARVLESLIAGDHGLLVSPALRQQWFDVLTRPDLVDRHGMASDVVAALLDRLEEGAVIDVPPRAQQEAPHRRDQLLWDLVEANSAALLVTGDGAFLRSRHFPGRIFSPRQFVEQFLDD